jgi:hypothetical protein
MENNEILYTANSPSDIKTSTFYSLSNLTLLLEAKGNLSNCQKKVQIATKNS